MEDYKHMYTEKRAEEEYISRLIKEYNYPETDIQKEFAYSFGRARYRFDIVVMKEGKPYILVEVKTRRRNLLSAIDQLRGYVKALDVEYVVVTDGFNDERFKVTRDAHETHLESIPDIPPYRKTLASIGKQSKKELVKAKPRQLNNIIWGILDKLRSYSGISQEEVFKKILKLLILKAYDEKSEKGIFRANFEEPPENIRSRIRILLEEAKKEYPTILENTLEVDDNILREIVYAFQKYSVKDSMEGSKLPINKVFGKDSYMYSTPKNLVKLMIDLLAPEKGSTFIDPACGIGGLLTEAASRGLKVTGIEILVDIAQYARANLALSGFRGEIITAESLGILDDNRRRNLKSYFDYAAVVPPLGRKVADERLYRFILGSNKRSQSTEVLFLEHTIRFLREGGRMSIVVPEGLLFGDYNYDAREFMLKHCTVKAIITLPAGLFMPLSSIRTALLFLEKSNKRGTRKEDQVYVANVEEKEDFKKIVKTYRDFENKKIIPEEADIFITNLENPKQINFDYVKGLRKLATKNGQTVFPDWPQVQLQNIARLSTGIRIKKLDSKDAGGEAIYIRAGDVSDLILNLDDTEKISTSGDFSRYAAKPGDILITRAGTVGRVALVQDNSTPLIIGSNVLRISVTDKKRVLPEFLLAVLKSNHGQTQIEMFTGGSTIRAISVSGVRQIMIPIPPIAEQEKVASQIKKIIETKMEAIKISNQLKLKEEKMVKKLNKMIGGE